MVIKKNSVNVSVTPEEETADKPVVKKAKPTSSTSEDAPKKKVVKKAAPKKVVKKKAAPEKAPKPKKKSGSLIQLTITIVVTAAVIGGGIYFWQDKTGEQKELTLKQEAMELKTDLENRLNLLKSKLTGVETENVELRVKTEELKEKAALLEKAKIDYDNEELGISFTYPAIFGDITTEQIAAATGTKTVGKFSDNEKLTFTSLSDDFTLEATSSEMDITTAEGHDYRRRTYYLLGPDEAELEIEPTHIIDVEKEEALVIDKNSFVIDPEADGLPINIGENVAAVINLDNENFSGLVIINQDFSILPLENFIKIIESIKIEKIQKE